MTLLLNQEAVKRKKAFYASYVQTEWIENGDGYKKEVITGYKHVEHLKKRLTQFGAVFMKTEEVIELPEQTEQKIFLKITNEYKFFIKHNYLELDTRNLVRFKDDSDFEGEDVTPRVELIGDNSLTKTLYCRQLCGQWHKEKLEAFRDLLESTEDRLIVFYNFNEELTRLRKICESLNREVSFVNGSGRSMYAYECVDNSVTFVQYQAGAMGGNYQKANKIVYFTLPLGKGSCDLWEQSKKRIHRIGQNRPCYYYYLICSKYSGDVVTNTEAAKRYSRFAVGQDAIPLAPHLLLPLYMKEESERELAMFMDMVLLGKCDELWVFGGEASAGMCAEIAKAKRYGKKIRYFDSLCNETNRALEIGPERLQEER